MITLGLALAFLVPQDGVLAPDPEPTAEETLALELVNHFRTDPAGEAEPVLAHPAVIDNLALDVEMFRREMAELAPAPPLVFQSRLALASRNHARYMRMHREYGHRETEAT